MRNIYEKLWIWIAWHLPTDLVKWCGVRVAAHASQGKWSGDVVPDITMMDALKRWEDSGEH